MCEGRIEFTFNNKNSDLSWLENSVTEKIFRSPLISVDNPCLILFHLCIHARTQDVDQNQILNYSIIRLNGSFVGNFDAEVVLRSGKRGKEINLSLLNLETNCGLQVDKNFTLQNKDICCRISFLDPDCHQYIADVGELNENIHQLLTGGEFCDLALCTTDNEFLVHKFMLRKRAPKLLEDLRLSDQNCLIERVKVDNISSVILQSLLRYIYSGKLDDLPDESLPEFYQLLEKFQLEDFTSVIHSENSAAITTRIKVFRRLISCKVDADEELSDKTILMQTLDFGCASFWMTVALKEIVWKPQVQTTIRCLSVLKEDFVMSWIMYEGLGNIDFQRKKMVFSSGKNKLKRIFTRDLDYSAERIRSGLNFKFKLALSNGSYFDNLLEFEGTPSIHEENTLFGMGVFRYDITKLGEDVFHNEGSGDVVLCFAGGKLSAHKAILATWSPVFSTMFQLEMKEKNTGEVNIPDLDYAAGLRLLRFMYSAEISAHNYEEDVQLYAAADKYQMPSLFAKCAYFLATHITAENACDMLVLADQHNDSNLFETAYKYLALNPGDVLGSNEWLSLIETQPKLVSKALQFIFGDLG